MARPRVHVVEDLAVSFVVLAMMVLPIAEIVLRRTLHTGITGSSLIVQHLGLLVGMLGGAIAAREGRLLALSTVADTMLRGNVKVASQIFSGAVGSIVSVFLMVAAFQFLQVEREVGKTLAYGIPTWTIELALPLGFAAIAARQVFRASGTWSGRVATMACVALLTILLVTAPTSAHIWIPALVVLVAAVVLGAPAFAALGGTALILFFSMREPIAAIPVSHYSLVTNPSIPSLPLFTLAGYALAESGAPRRLIRVFDALFSRFRGGAAIVTVVVCTFFTSFTGASGVTILALGGLLMPILIGAGYSEKNALGLVTGSGSLGLLLPPCLPIIVYAIVAHIPLEQMFLAGLLPAVVMAAATAWWGVRQAPPYVGSGFSRISGSGFSQASVGSGFSQASVGSGFSRISSGEKARTFNAAEARAAIWDAKWELLTPVLAFVALFSGLATAVEAAAVTAAYALLVETVLHRDLSFSRDWPRVLTECGVLVGGVLLILGVALGFTNYLVDADVPTRAVEWTTRTVQSPLLFLLLLNLFLGVVGCLMDIYSAIVIQVPLLVPLGVAYKIDPVHLGVIFLANLELGYLTPPVGLNLFLSSCRFNKPVPEVVRSVLPIILVLAIGVLLITYVPWLTTALPRFFAP